MEEQRGGGLKGGRGERLQAELDLHRTRVRRLESQVSSMGLEAAALPVSAWDPFQAPSTIAAAGTRSSKQAAVQPSLQGVRLLLLASQALTQTCVRKILKV